MQSALALMKLTFEPVRWMVDGIVPEGIILIAGKPKSGKSWFALNMALSAVLGMPFLGRKVHEVGALYLALEDVPRRMQRRLAVLLDGIDDLSALDKLHIAYEWPNGLAGANKLREYLKENQDCTLVVVDVLKKIKPANGGGTRSEYDKDYEAIEPWKKVVEEFNVTLVLVHHTRKAFGEEVFDEISGTLGLNGVVDQLCVLKRMGAEGKRAALHMRGRDLEEDFEGDLELRQGWWMLAEALPDKPVLTAARKRVIDALKLEGGRAMPHTLQKRCGALSGGSFGTLLRRMVEDGLIEKDGDEAGWYRLPKPIGPEEPS